MRQAVETRTELRDCDQHTRLRGGFVKLPCERETFDYAGNAFADRVDRRYAIAIGAEDHAHIEAPRQRVVKMVLEGMVFP